MPQVSALKGKRVQLRRMLSDVEKSPPPWAITRNNLEMFGVDHGAVRPLTRDGALRWVLVIILMPGG